MEHGARIDRDLFAIAEGAAFAARGLVGGAASEALGFARRAALAGARSRLGSTAASSSANASSAYTASRWMPGTEVWQAVKPKFMKPA